MTKDIIIEAMETAGLTYDPKADHPLFYTPDMYPIDFKTWDEAYEWIDTAEFSYYPGMREEVQTILHCKTNRMSREVCGEKKIHVNNKYWNEEYEIDRTEIIDNK